MATFNIEAAAKYGGVGTMLELKDAARKESEETRTQELHPIKVEREKADLDSKRVETDKARQVLKELKGNEEFNRAVLEYQATNASLTTKYLEENPREAMAGIAAEYKKKANDLGWEEQKRRSDATSNFIYTVKQMKSEGASATQIDNMYNSFSDKWTDMFKGNWAKDNNIDDSNGITDKNWKNFTNAGQDAVFGSTYLAERMKQETLMQSEIFKQSVKVQGKKDVEQFKHQLKEGDTNANEFILPNGQKITSAEIRQVHKSKYDILDDIDIRILASSNPVAAEKEREKAKNAPQLDDFAREEYGVDLYGKQSRRTSGDPVNPTFDQLPPPSEHIGATITDNQTGHTLRVKNVGGAWKWVDEITGKEAQ